MRTRGPELQPGRAEGYTQLTSPDAAAVVLRHDLDVFDTAYGLPAADLYVVSPLGPISHDPPTDPFAAFLNLNFTSQIEWLHAMAPGATIVVIEAPCGQLSDLADYQCLEQAMSRMLDRHLVGEIMEPGGDGEAALGPDVVLGGTRGWILQAARLLSDVAQPMWTVLKDPVFHM